MKSVGLRIARPLWDKASAIKAVNLGYDSLGRAVGKRSAPRNSNHPFIARSSQFNIEMPTSKHALWSMPEYRYLYSFADRIKAGLWLALGSLGQALSPLGVRPRPKKGLRQNKIYMRGKAFSCSQSLSLSLSLSLEIEIAMLSRGLRYKRKEKVFLIND